MQGLDGAIEAAMGCVYPLRMRWSMLMRFSCLIRREEVGCNFTVRKVPDTMESVQFLKDGLLDRYHGD